MKINHWLSSFDRNICYRLYIYEEKRTFCVLVYRKKKKLNNKCECLYIYLFKWKKVWIWNTLRFKSLYLPEKFRNDILSWFIYIFMSLLPIAWLKIYLILFRWHDSLNIFSIKTRAYMNYFKIMQCKANFIVIYHLEETLKGYQRTNYIQGTYKISLRVFHFKTYSSA